MTRLVFMGTPDFAAIALAALQDAGHDIAAVYSQPPRPAGRGKQSRKSPVQSLANELGLPTETPNNLKSSDAAERLEDYAPECLVVAAYGLILPGAMLEVPGLGAINIHASLLPRWRGAAPIQRAIMAGDTETGVSLMQMDEGLDTGGVLRTKTIPINEAETAASLHDRLAVLGAQMIVDHLPGILAERILPIAQNHAAATNAAKIDKREAEIDWGEAAPVIERKIRALNPFPGAWTRIGGERLKILRGAVEASAGKPGSVLDDRLLVATGEGALRILEAQRQGRAALASNELLRGFAIPPGTELGG